MVTMPPELLNSPLLVSLIGAVAVAVACKDTDQAKASM